VNIPYEHTSPNYSDRLSKNTAPVDSDLMDVLDEMGNGEVDDILDVLFGTYPFMLDLLPENTVQYRGDLRLRDSQLKDASGKPVFQCDVALPILPEPLFRNVDDEVALLSGLRNSVML
jgi:hypothetical protein